MPTATAFDLNTLLKLAHASYCEKKAGRLGFNPITRMKYNKIKQNTDIINIKSVA